MRESTIKNNSKRKLGVIFTCAVMISALGTGTAFAANAVISNSKQTAMKQGVKSINVAPSTDAVGGEAMHINKHGIHEYSVDGGQTWSKDLPEGFMLDSHGNLEKIK